MTDRPSTPTEITEDMLHAYVDGQLTAAECEAVKAYLEHSPDLARDVAAWQAQNAALNGLFPEAEAIERVAGRSAAKAAPTLDPAETPSSLWRIAAAIALLAVGVAAGWTLRGLPDQQGEGALANTPSFETRARVAHAVYVPEVLHPVEVAADQEAHLVTWLSNRLGAPLAAPDLVQLGYTLLGGRLLPSGDGPAAQMMYQNAAGDRITVYLTAGAPGVLASFRFSDPDQQVASVTWADDRFRYAVIGQLPRDDLFAVATEIYRQFL